MGEDEARDGEHRLRSVIRRARARLSRIAGRELLIGKTWWVLGAGAAVSACRPLLWRLADEAPLWVGFARALGLFVAGSAAAVGAIVVAGRRRGPSEVGAARALDGALGHAEIVASGFAFARDGRVEPVALLARRRAVEAAGSAVAEALFPLPSLRPSPRKAALFAFGAAAALGVGGYDRGLATALLTPPTSTENGAAAELDEAAAELEDQLHQESPQRTPDHPAPQRSRGDDRLEGAGPTLADKAREAARAARRGDRKGALEKLDELRATGGQQAEKAGDLGATLRRIAEALGPSPDKAHAGAAGKSGEPGAAESMRLLAQKMRAPEGGAAGEESKERMLERLERAGEEARRAGSAGKSEGANDAARALSRAAEALRRGDREAAAQALDEAAARAGAMEKARADAAAEAMAIVEMLEKSGALEHAIQMAMLGREGEGRGDDGPGRGGKGEGAGEGQGGEKSAALRSAILARLVAMGMAGEASGHPGGNTLEPHVADRHRAHRDPLAATESLRAPSQVGEGARAIQAIHGLGRGSEPPASYREVFPSYDAAAEEGMADERIPAQRRSAVRRYFQTIRPEK